ncbi:ferrous iron transport protein B, partial [bacterium]|nr:ferrous iron transport protein B [bacterium]
IDIRLLDLPGTYSLNPQSLDEQISRDVLLGRLAGQEPPCAAIVVVDASNLHRNLYYATQVIELGYPTIVALNMMDVAEQIGQKVDTRRLGELLGVKVVPLVASTAQGIPELQAALVATLRAGTPLPGKLFPDLPRAFSDEVETLAAMLARLSRDKSAGAMPKAEALLLLSNAKTSGPTGYPELVHDFVEEAHKRLETAGIDWSVCAVESRYRKVADIHHCCVRDTTAGAETFSDRIDRVLTHSVWGTLIFLASMAVMFQAIFTLAPIPMDALQAGVDWCGRFVGGLMPPGDLNDLLVNGVIAGVGAVVVFLPQILLLFLFLGLLEDTGYMARAALLMDRLMSRVGLHGKSFIPMLSSFACAIPGIMATRTIENRRDRLVTILIAPLMSCSARLPVYTLLIAACIPNVMVLGMFKLPALVMLGMYL